jgi:hypothetical protein
LRTQITFMLPEVFIDYGNQITAIISNLLIA